jgi:hypothetical protein
MKILDLAAVAETKEAAAAEAHSAIIPIRDAPYAHQLFSDSAELECFRLHFFLFYSGTYRPSFALWLWSWFAIMPVEDQSTQVPFNKKRRPTWLSQSAFPLRSLRPHSAPARTDRTW